MQSSKVWIAALLISVLFVGTYISLRPTVFVSPTGNDQNDGTRSHPVQTIQRGVDLAKNGGTVLIAPGIYRETVTLSGKNSFSKSLTVRANTSKDERVILSGSEPSFLLDWQRCNASVCPNILPSIRNHVYIASLPWHEPPTTIIETTPDNTQHQLILARSPNEKIEDENKYHEFWWQASGRNASPSRLVDHTHLPAIPDVTGGRAFIMDGADRCGAFVYVRSIKKHSGVEGSITTDIPIGALTYGNQETGVGEYSKYFIDNAIGLLDSPGEWFYDRRDTNLYLWPLGEKDPATLPVEIGRKNTGIRIDRSRVTIDGIIIKNINDHDYFNRPTGAIVIAPNTTHITIRNIETAYAGSGVLAQASDTQTIHHVRIEHASFHHVAKSPITFIGSTTNPQGLKNIYISKSNIRESGFPFNEPAIYITRASNVRIRDNHIQQTAGSGIHITGFEKSPAVVANVRISGNSIGRACQNASACAGLKIFGGTFTNVRISYNSIHDNLGWSFCQEATKGKKGEAIGIFISNAKGITVSHNQSLRNSSAAYLAFTRQFPTTDNKFVANLAAESLVGIALTGSGNDSDTNPRADATRHDNTKILRNILRGNITALDVDAANPSSLRIRGNVIKD